MTDLLPVAFYKHLYTLILSFSTSTSLFSGNIFQLRGNVCEWWPWKIIL